MSNRLQITYANRLRSNPTWNSLVDYFNKVYKYDVQAISTTDFDVLVRSQDEKEVAYIFLEVTSLMSPNSHLDDWILMPSKAQKVLVLVGDKDDGSHYRALQEIQLRLLDQGAMITILPLMNIEQMQAHLDRIDIAGSSSHPASDLSNRSSAEQIISSATTSVPHSPLTSQDIQQIRQLCGSLEGLEKATRCVAGQQQLESCLGSDKAQALSTFWDDEWLAQWWFRVCSPSVVADKMLADCHQTIVAS